MINVPNKYLGIGFFAFWRNNFTDLAQSYNLGWRLFIRDFVARYRQKVLGVLWVLITPTIAAATFAVLAGSGILNVGSLDMPYPVYVFLGVTFWQMIQNPIINTAEVLNKTGVVILRINFPRICLIIAPLYITLLNFVIQFVLFIAICQIYGFDFHLTGLLVPLLLIPALLFGIGLGMVLAIIGAVIKDVSNMITYLFGFLMLITPIAYARPEASFIGAMAKWNPFYYLIVVPRDLLLFGSSPDLAGFACCSLLALVILFMGWRFFVVAIARITEKI